MSDNNIKDVATKNITYWIDRIWEKGYSQGRKDTERKFSEKDETTTLTRATEEQKKNYEWFGLECFCDKCEKGLGFHSGFFTFCPHCGRKIIRKEENECHTV